ncbi:MAG: efflux RND transporter permease subunit [Patescibacteria group bacterium]|nr:efflux RND transporter permease subunit [Patescibacteria group bacterium]MDE1965919.1 efflux RND transporter permease subunit [Patescibacteria group bacterium]
MLWLWNFFLNKRQFSYVLIGTLLVAGSFALLRIPKENYPAIVIPDGFVVVTLPGASSADMETLVTDKLEDQISGISNIDTMTSMSGDGVSEVTVQFVASADITQSIQDLRDAVARAVPDLPADASAPQVLKINFSDQPILVASISGSLPPTQFSALGKTVSDDLKRITGVSSVDVAGVPAREVDVVVSKEKLAQYGLSLSGVIAAIAASNSALPAGSIEMNGVNYDVNFKGGLTDSSQIESVAVGQVNGAPIYLRDVALIADGLAPATTYSRLSLGGKPSSEAITLTVYKQSGASIQGTADAVRAELENLKKTDLAGLDVFIPPSTDAGAQVGKQLGDLASTGVVTVLLVIAVLLLTIGWRESLVAALSIPISFLVAFLALYLSGNTLNFISLFALILAVGILVDSGIVVTEAIHARMKIYEDPLDAARAALHDYAWPLIAGTMATVAVFAPLFFISGIVGKFIAGIPYTLIFVLLASIFVALGVVPLIAIVLTKKHQNRLEAFQERTTDRVTLWYKRTLRIILESRRFQRIFLRSLGALFVLSLLLPMSGLVQSVFFPQSDQDYVFVNLETPEGTTLAKTDLAVREVEEILYADPDISSFQTTVGQSSALTGGGPQGGGSTSGNTANITVNLPTGHRKTSTAVVSDLEKRLSAVTDASIQVLQASDGPPSGSPIQIQFEGDDLSALIQAADSGKQLLSTIPHVTNITSSTQNNGTEFDLAIDRAKAAAYGVSTAEVAQMLRASVNGMKATTITEPGQNIDVVVRLNLNAAYATPSDTTKTTIDSIKNLTVPGANGPVLLGSILADSLGQSNASISHKDKKRIETVSAYPDSDTTTTAVIAAFEKRIGELHLPASVAVSYGGEAQNINQSFTDMFVALIAGLLLMFMILIIAFNSFRYTWYLLVIVPLSLIGVLDGLALTGQPVSFSSLLGVIALGGVIINHAIILMDSMIHRLRAEPERAPLDVVVDAAATRLRPIFLTTVATVIGMIPLSLTNAMWGPLADAIMFGLTFAIVLTLVLVPTLFYRAQVRDRERASRAA